MKQDFINLFIFKDHLTSRTFQVPFVWLRRLNLILLIVLLLLASTTIVSTRYLLIKYTKKQNQIIVLEKEIQELKQVQTVKKEQSLPQPPAQPLSQPTTNITLPDPASLNIRLAEPKAKWIGNNLDVQFNIQYIKEDGGNQQGKILILARGPEILLAYPSGALNVKELKSFLNPDKGEFFSVSRFRIGNTKFGLVLQKEYISEVQILIFNKDNELLLVEAIIPEKMSKKTTNKQATPIPTSSPQ